MRHVYACLTSIWLMIFVWSVCRSTGNEQFKLPLPLSSQLVPRSPLRSNYENTDVRKKNPSTAAIKCEQNKHDTMHRHHDTQNTNLITPSEHFLFLMRNRASTMYVRWKFFIKREKKMALFHANPQGIISRHTMRYFSLKEKNFLV